MSATINTSPIPIDLDMAQDFLHQLDPKGIFTFQTFPEGNASGGAVVRHGTLNEHANELARLNRSGHGIFVMINRGDGIKHEGCNTCRTSKSVIAVRALFLDLDGTSPTPLLDASPPPKILIASSPGRYHAYWPVSDCKLDQFSELQKRLAAKYAGDTTVHDLCRVMRLPGFVHNKREPFQTRIIGIEDLS